MIWNLSRRFWRRTYFWRLGAIAFVLSWVLAFPAAIAQTTGKATPTPTRRNTEAPVVLDGRQIFSVSASGEFSAQERADLINLQLRNAIESTEPLQVQVVERNQLPTILLNDRYLLTVTERDGGRETSAPVQAKLWAERLQVGLQKAQEERTPRYLQQALIRLVVMMAIAIALYGGLGLLWERFRRTLQRLIPIPDSDSHTDEAAGALNLFLGLTLAIARFTVWFVVVFYSTNLFPLTRQWSYRIRDSLIATFTAPLFTLAGQPYSVINLLILIGLLAAWVIIASTITKLMRSRILSVAGINRSAQEAVAIIIKYTLLTLGTLVLLQIWGLDISSLTILASALGVGIGFGFQDIAKNFGSGLVLFFERRIQVGDFVEVGEYRGTIEQIGSRSTVIRSLDNLSIIVPNSRFLETEVINWSHHNPISRLGVPVRVAYGSDVSTVKATLLEAVKEQERVLNFPAPQVFFRGFGDNSLDFELLVWTAEPSKQFLIKSELYFRIETLLRQHGVQVPFPQRDLHVRSGTLPLGLSPELEQALLKLVEQFAQKHNHHSSDQSDLLK